MQLLPISQPKEWGVGTTTSPGWGYVDFNDDSMQLSSNVMNIYKIIIHQLSFVIFPLLPMFPTRMGMNLIYNISLILLKCISLYLINICVVQVCLLVHIIGIQAHPKFLLKNNMTEVNFESLILKQEKKQQYNSFKNRNFFWC